MERAQLMSDAITELKYILELTYWELAKNEPSWVMRVQALIKEASASVTPVMRSLPLDELLKKYHEFLGDKQDIEWLIATKEDELIKEFLGGNDA